MTLEADEPILNILLEYTQEWYKDMKEWMYKMFGIKLPYGNDVGSRVETTSKGKGSFGIGSQYEEDVFSFWELVSYQHTVIIG